MTKKENKSNLTAMPLDEFIDENFEGSQSSFGRAQGVLRQQVTQWIKSEYIVVNNCLYSKRRELKKE